MGFKILVSDNVHHEGIEILKGRSGFETDIVSGLKPTELKEIISGYDGLFVRSCD